MKNCENCKTVLPVGAKFCFHCGAPQIDKATEESSNRIDPEKDIGAQINEQFFLALKDRVEAEHNPKKFQVYAERLYESGFRETIYRRSEQLANRVARNKNSKQINQWIDNLYNELLDFFLIHYCKDLNEVLLPEAILKYQNVTLEQIDLPQLIFDYLDFDNEQEQIYMDFLTMPIDKLKNAGKSFLFPEKQEKILLICDQSLFGSCKEGFALTEKALYWKAHLEKARKVNFQAINEVKRTEDWITINGLFFNANPSINLKMLKLLKKLNHIF